MYKMCNHCLVITCYLLKSTHFTLLDVNEKPACNYFEISYCTVSGIYTRHCSVKVDLRSELSEFYKTFIIRETMSPILETRLLKLSTLL